MPSGGPSSATPGDVFDVQNLGQGRLLLVLLERQNPEPGMNLERCLEAIAAAPLRPTWDSLKAISREP
jgi:hypothetical protein